MTSLPPPSGDMEKLLAKLTDCIVFLDEEGYRMTADDLVSIREGLRDIEIASRDRIQRNREGLEKMFAKMNELDTPKRGELHLLLISLFS